MKNGTFYSLGATYLSHYGRKGMKWGKNIFDNPAASAYNQGKKAENMQRGLNNGSVISTYKGPTTMAVHTPTENSGLLARKANKKRYEQKNQEAIAFYAQVRAENPERAKRMREEYKERLSRVIDKNTGKVLNDANKAEIKRINEITEQIYGYRLDLQPGKLPAVGEKVGMWTAITKK